jgi:histidinol-phosphate aminotransferase
MIEIPEHIKKLKPYKAGKPIEDLAREKGIEKIVKLASNENPLGPSPKAVEVIKNYVNELHRYTNPSGFKLVNAISKKYNVKPEQIVTAHGSDSILQYLITAFTDEKDEILTSEGSFIGWYVNANKYGRRQTLVPLKDYHYDLKRIAESVTEKTKIVYLANPNNPTGTAFSKEEFKIFLDKIPSNVLIVLDEAYTVYAEEDVNYPNGLDYLRDNLIVCRTLSKAYGLAGLRVGFAIGPEYLIREMYKVKLPFEPNLLAQEAAIAAFDDDEFLNRTKKLNRWSLGKIIETLDYLGIKHIPSAANFLLMVFDSPDFAAEFNAECLNKGLILRLVDTFGIPEGVRINSGTEEETEFAMNVIREVYNVMTIKS